MHRKARMMFLKPGQFKFIVSLLLFFRFDAELELITALGTGNREGHVDAAQNVVRVGLAVEESLAFIVSLKRKCMKWLTILRWTFKSIIWK